MDIPKQKKMGFGASVAACTDYSPHPFQFSSELRAVMEPHLVNGRRAREVAIASVSESVKEAIKTESWFESASSLSTTSYDSHLYRLRQTLADALLNTGGKDVELERFHELVLASDARNKVGAMHRLRDISLRQPFQIAYEAFVLDVALPWLAAVVDGENSGHTTAGAAQHSLLKEAHFQAFPCIRVLQPGEFSLPPHCDAAYGHPLCAINFIVPLTAAPGAGALYCESAEGSEDWAPVTNLGNGFLTKFNGTRCLHWTSENTESTTRVSLDFRVIPGEKLWAAVMKANDDPYAAAGGFYAHAVCGDATQVCRCDKSNIGSSDADGGTFAAAEVGSGPTNPCSCRRCGWSTLGFLPTPDKRVGFPFVGK
jgi:hypothetical protein